jgi:citrate lyase subunit beta/citryl-CoA lyase
MQAIHLDRVEAINQAFTPAEDKIQQARDVIAAFDTSPSLGSLQFNGRMIDKPHLKLARRMVDVAAEETV